MWELVTRLLWLPFDIMQRLSIRFLQLGRSIYASLTGPASKKPPLKPAPEPSAPSSSPPCPPRFTTSSSSASSFPALSLENIALPLQSSPKTPSLLSNSIQSVTLSSCIAIEMEPSVQIPEEPKSQPPPPPVAIAKTESVSLSTLDRIIMSNVGQGLSATADSTDKPHTSISVPTSLETVSVVMMAEAVDPPEHCVQVDCSISAEVPDRNSPVIPDKRFCEKRRQISKQINSFGSNDGPNTDSQSSSEAKRPKMSEECVAENISTVELARQDATCTTTAVKKNKKRRSKKNKRIEESGEGDKTMMGRAPPPNFFIAIQISDKEIVSNVADLQKSLTERNLSQKWHELTTTEIFKDAMVPVTKLHFTLHVMHLKGEEDMAKAQNVLAECCKEVHQEFSESPMDLTIEGLGHFRNNVIFAQIKEQSHITRLTQLSELFRQKFRDMNIPVDPRPFNPHMTIAKISRSNKLHKKKIRAFPSEMWTDCEQKCFGKQRVSGLQLLQMAGEDKATGYYQCFGQHYFEDPLSSPTERQESIENKNEKE